MRAVFGFVGILMVMGIGYFIYSTQIQSGPNGIPLPKQTNFVAIRQDLLSLGRSEGLYLATNGSYATIEQLKSSGVASIIPDGNRWGYEYSIEVEGAAHFVVTAKPIDSSRPGQPTLSIDETMQIAS
jgi:hypothetical protein